MVLYRSQLGRNIAILLAMFLLSFATLSAQNGITLYNTSNSGIPDNSVHVVKALPSGIIWAGTDWGLTQFDGNNWTVYQTANSGLPGNSVRAIALDDSGAVWVGSLTGGLARLHAGNWTVWNTGNSPLPSDHVRAIAIDKGNGVWAGGPGGLVKFDGMNWEVFDFMAGGHESNHVASLLSLGSDTLWVGLVNGGLLLMEDTTKTFHTLGNSGLPDNTILGIARDSGDDLWLSAPFAAAINYLNLNFFEYNSYNSNNPSNSTVGVVLDALENPWYASLDKGIVHYDGITWRHYDASNSSVPQDYIRSIDFDPSSGLIWAGSHSAGLFSLNPATVLALEENLEEGFSLYPNPAHQAVSIFLPESGAEDWNLRIFDAEGRRVHEQLVFNNSTPILLDVSQLAAGVYLLEINGIESMLRLRKRLLVID